MRKLVMSGPTEKKKKKNILFQFIYFIMIASFFLNLSNHLIFELRFLGIKNRIQAENERIECKARCVRYTCRAPRSIWILFSLNELERRRLI
jgi:hypothetical protein